MTKDIFDNKKILIVVAHPDDEILGIGGSMHKIARTCNSETLVLILGEGLTSRSESRNLSQWDNDLKRHKKNIKSAAREIGFSDVITYDFPDNRFDTQPLLDIVKVVEKHKVDFEPDIVFTHHGGDLNIDHRKTFQAVMTAFRPLSEERLKAIITFETMSGTEWRPSNDPNHFVPNLFISFDEVDLTAKIKAMESYEFEKRKYPHPRSPEALKIRAEMWGISIGKAYAEAFQVIRLING